MIDLRASTAKELETNATLRGHGFEIVRYRDDRGRLDHLNRTECRGSPRPRLEATKRAKVMREVPHTPELIVLLAILGIVDRDARLAMIEKLAMSAVVNAASRQAVEIIRSTTLNFGEHCDLLRAMDKLREEAGA